MFFNLGLWWQPTNSELIREVAEQIVNEQLLGNWKIYAALIAISLVAGYSGSWLAAYAKKRGETSATKADMDKILAQLEATTKVAEEVRVSVNHADWVAREWRSVRRTKLEELLNAVYLLDDWLEEQQQKWVYREAVKVDNLPMSTVKVLSALYFPELRAPTSAVAVAHHQASLVILDIGSKVNAAKTSPEAYQQLMSEFVERWKPVYQAAVDATTVLETQAIALMTEKIAAT